MASPWWDSNWNPKAAAGQNQDDILTIRARPPGAQAVKRHAAPSPVRANTISFNNNILIDWSRLSFSSARHVDLEDGELPQGFNIHETLGSSNSVVKRVEVLGTSLAMKTYKADTEERQSKVLAEISILRRLRHYHIIEYVGSFRQANPANPHNPKLSALFWPVAPCGLDRFIQEIDTLALAICNGGLEPSQLADSIRNPVLGSAASLLRGIVYPSADKRNSFRVDKILRAAIRRLFGSFGCLADALCYVHRQRVSHKDIKPSNILIYPNETTYQSTESNPQGERVMDGLRLTDFDGANDFSQNLVSTAEHGWYTYPYASPETINKRKSGRACDIFSMGCVYLEMLALATIYPRLLSTQTDSASPPHYISGLDLRTDIGPTAGKCPKLASLVAKVGESLPAQPPAQREGTYRLQSIIVSMLSWEPTSRPSADMVLSRLSAADVLRETSREDRTLSDYPLFGNCCARYALSIHEARHLLPATIIDKEGTGTSVATTNDQAGATVPQTETPPPVPEKGRDQLSPPPDTPLTDDPSSQKSPNGLDNGDDDDQPSEADEAAATAFTVPPVVRDQYTIQWNKHGQRIDPPTVEYNRAAFDRIKKLELCQYRYLMGVCQTVDTCKYEHRYVLSKRELEILRALKRRQQVCPWGTACTNSACFSGHNCPNTRPCTAPEDRTKTSRCAFGGPSDSCFFPKDMHDMDLRVAYCT